MGKFKSLSKEDFWRPNKGRFFILFLISIIFITSCSKKNKSNNSELARNFGLDFIKVNEAKYSDIPLPIGYAFVDMGKKSLQKDDKYSDLFCYEGELACEQVSDYYRVNMERCGWEIVDMSNEQEGLLFCNKLNKYCIVSIRDDFDINKYDSKKSYIYLFVKNKFNDESSKTKDINLKGIL